MEVFLFLHCGDERMEKTYPVQSKGQW